MEPVLTSSESRRTIDRIRRIFIESLRLNLREEELSYEDKLDEITGLDSMAVLEFLAAIEQEFGVTIEPEMMTIELARDQKALAVYVDGLCAQRRPPLDNPE